MYKALDIAKKIIEMANVDTTSGGDGMTNLKLQKILYYEQGYHLAYFGKPLFKEDIESWMYGPVVPEVYEYYNKYQATALPIEKYSLHLSERENALFFNVYEALKEFSAIGLMNRTHQETPWKEAKPHDRGTVISIESMMSYFKARI